MENTGVWERKRVINELMQGFEHAKQLQSVHSPSAATELLTQSILSSIGKVINMLMSRDCEGETEPTDPPHSISGSPHSENSNGTTFREDECRALSKKRKMVPKCTMGPSSLLTTCTLLWKDLSSHFSSLEQDLLSKSQAIHHKLQSLHHSTNQTLETLNRRKLSIDGSVDTSSKPLPSSPSMNPLIFLILPTRLLFSSQFHVLLLQVNGLGGVLEFRCAEEEGSPTCFYCSTDSDADLNEGSNLEEMNQMYPINI